MRPLEESEAAARILARLRVSGAVLARDERRGDFAVLADGDRRRRPTGRLAAAATLMLAADGALIAVSEDRYIISEAGRARALRDRARGDEGYRAQHEEIADRVVMDGDGGVRPARGVDPAGPLVRLEKLTDAEGKQYFSAAELAAARTLRADWDGGQQGLVRGSNWTAPPRGGTPRGSGGGAELAHASAIDARRRVEKALAALAPILADAVRALCLREQGFADVERENVWPARAGKLALKCALAQLAEYYRR